MPVLDQDDRVSAEALAKAVNDSRITTYWDAEQTLGLGLRDAMRLSTFIAWDIYMLYKPGTTWTVDEIPQPDIWMHQMSDEPMINWFDSNQLAHHTHNLLNQIP